MIAVVLAAVALAATEAEVLDRVAQTQELRQFRMAPGAPPIPAADYAKIARGDTVTGLVVVEGFAAKKGYGARVIDQPIGRLWAAINDEAQHPERTRLEYSELLAGTSCLSGRKVFQYLPLPLMSNRWWITNIRFNLGLSRRTDGRVREIAWQSSDPVADLVSIKSPAARAYVEKGIPLEFTKGGWLLVDIDGASTLVEYYVWSDPGGSLPAGAASLFATGGIKDTLEAMGRFASDGGYACADD